MCVRASPVLQQHQYRIAGVCVIDVVEGLQSLSVGIAGCLANYVFPHTEFTLDALPLMHSLLNARPEGFDSPEEAIEWQ